MAKKLEKHQDYIYLQEDYYNKPKETFNFILNLIKKFHKKKINSILDLGCARGEWLYFVKKKTNIKELVGVDYSQNLINEGKRNLGDFNIKFYKGSAETIKIKKKFDVIIASGLVSYFDDINKFLNNSLKKLNKGGILIILDNFNPYDVDVILKYRNNKYSKNFEKGWNLHSIETVKRSLINKKAKLIKIKKFNLSFNLKKNIDPLRSWHTSVGGKKIFTNGLSQIFDIKSLIIQK
tara:strand:+ start:1117 stop:1824 length:708 start_codon:yes stop_codon:yes gene_type:complete